MHRGRALVERPADVQAVLLRRPDGLRARGRQAGAVRRGVRREHAVRLRLDSLPVLLAIRRRTAIRLAVRVGLAPTLPHLVGVLRRVVLAEDLEHLLGGQLDPHPVCLHRPFQRRDDPSQPLHLVGQRRMPAAEVVDGVDGRVVEQRGDLLEREAELAVGEYLLQSLQVVVAVVPVARGGAPARRDQADLVVVVQRPHRHPRCAGDFADRPAHRPAPFDHLARDARG